jgi:single-stranded DNA-binding protein
MWINTKTGSIIAGNATKDAEFKLVGEKKSPLLKISTAIGKDERGDTKYAEIAAWNRLARKLSEYGIKKGDPVTAFGSWESNTKGGKTYWTFRADDVVAFNNHAVAEDSQSSEFEGAGALEGIEAFNDVDFGEIPDFMRTS